MPSREQSALKANRAADGNDGQDPATPEPTRKLLLQLSEKYNVPAVDLAQMTLSLADLDFLPQDIAARHMVLPLLIKDDAIFLGMATPSNRQAVEEIEFVSGKRVFPYVTDPELLAQTLERAYAAKATGATTLAGERVSGTARSSGAAALAQGPAATPASPPPPAGVPPGAGSPRPQPPPTPPPLRSKRATIMSGGGTPASVPALAGAQPRHATPSKVTPKSTPKAPLSPSFPPTERSVTVPVVSGASLASVPATRTMQGFGRTPEIAPTLAPPPPMPTMPAPPLLEEDGAAVPSVAISPRAEGGPRKALIVDADDEARGALRTALEADGFTVTESSLGEALLDRLRTEVPDVVVIDPELGYVHGLDLCRQIREDAQLAMVSVVIATRRFTGWRYSTDLLDAFGVKAVMVKPLALAQTVEKIGALLDGKPSELETDHLGPEADAELKSGMEAYRRSELNEAIAHLERAVVAAPDSFRVHYQLALLVGRRGELFRAIQELERSVELDGHFFAALKNLAVLYEKAGFRRKAAEAWERSLLSAPDEPTRVILRERVLALL